MRRSDGFLYLGGSGGKVAGSSWDYARRRSVHFVPDPRGPILEGDFTERVERAESPAADFQIAADFILVRVPLLLGVDGLLGIFVP
jgi:hypothetical protein